MKTVILKFISFLVINIVCLVLVNHVMLFSGQQLLALFFMILISTTGVVWVADLWVYYQKKELRVMQQRMALTIKGDSPRIVLTEPNLPYYDVIRQFNALQSYIRDEQLSARRDINNYQSLLASLPVGVINVNRQHVVDVFNQTAADLLGVELRQTPVTESLVIQQFTLSELINQTFNAQKNQRSVLNLQINGETKQFEASTLYHKNDSQYAEVMVILYDLTSVLQIERMQSDFLANASHELKTPLTAITGFVETLQGKAGEDPTVRAQFLKIVADETNRLALLVNDILSISRSYQNSDDKQVSLAVHTIVTDQWQHMKTIAASKNVTFINNVPQDFTIYGFKHDLQTILQNLIGNAIKYNVLNGSVTVSAYQHDSYWQLEVKDTGIGIPKQQQSRIFERFYRGDESRQRHIASGTGLGLAIVNELVSKHHGEINVNSQVAVGTTIVIKLPL